MKHIKGRETSFIGINAPPIRCIKAHNVSYLKSNFQAFKFDERLYNIYHSLASLQEMPCFSYSPLLRAEAMIKFNKDFDKYVAGYDIGLDFDNKGEYDLCWQDCKQVKDVFDAYGVPYRLKCSGSGFHIEIPDRAVKEYSFGNVDRAVKLAGLFGKKLAILTGVSINLSGDVAIDRSIFDKRRIWKAPYSFDVKSGNVALPLRDKEFEQMCFGLDFVSARNVMDNIKIRNRGLLEREGNKNKFKEFVNELIIGEEDKDFIVDGEQDLEPTEKEAGVKNCAM